MKASHAEGTPWSELAVLYRINAQAPALEAALTEAGVPYTVRAPSASTTGPRCARPSSSSAGGVPHTGAVPVELMARVLSGLGWKSEAPGGQGRQRERWESLDALRTMVVEESEARSGLDAAQAASWLQERASWQASPVADAVTLSTLHAAKGLEWEGVAIVGVREGLIPFALSQEEPELSEERRLLYVGFTRAKRELRISWAASRGSATRSRFIADQVTGPATVSRRQSKATTSSKSRKCRVCGGLLHTAGERKLSRHEDCEVNFDEALFESLRAWRRSVAEEAKVPAFVVFTDATLQAIAEAEPSNAAELLRLPGIGQSKVTKYGEGALEVIARHQG
ncbi:3'-5' exonuclease [Tessaracoccus coleopterorum]|uniref:3'-5' exonuclease n=1 Tax=Tessaracoccus coleopterorum TaxID=2714950 RepID=UPI001E4A70B9|nr:3'-5' exonuclease [Tessaracoccus coleopterorum]